MKDTLDSTDESLEEFVLAMMVLPLEASMLMFSDTPLISQRLDMAEVGAKRFVFAISLLDTTIQDGSMKERGDVLVWSYTNP